MHPLMTRECDQSVSRRGFVLVTLFLRPFPFALELLIDLSGVWLPRLPSRLGSKEVTQLLSAKEDKTYQREVALLLLLH